MLPRLKLLAFMLRSGRQFTAAEVAAHFEVGRKTIVRDLITLRDQLGYDYVYQHGRYTLVTAPAPTL